MKHQMLRQVKLVTHIINSKGNEVAKAESATTD